MFEAGNGKGIGVNKGVILRTSDLVKYKIKAQDH
jgi:hypothetical protein